MLSGLLPSHFLSSDPIQDLRSSVADYLKEEIAAEAVVQNIPFFAEFLHVAALTSGELLNYTNVGRETGVSAKVVRQYFHTKGLRATNNKSNDDILQIFFAQRFKLLDNSRKYDINTLDNSRNNIILIFENSHKHSC